MHSGLSLRADRAATLAIGALLFIAFILPVAAYWPGIMSWDAAREYGMALRDPMDDWHPPVMIWVWRQMLRLWTGPASMLVLQLSLYIIGWGLLAWTALRAGYPRRAMGFAACSLFPIALALEGCVLKDSLMAGALLMALGLLAPPAPSRAARITACFLLMFTATLRFNALFACLPLFVAALPGGLRATRARFAGTVVVSALVLAGATPAANRLIGAQRSGVELSQIVFDLGGITRFSGTDVFPPVGIPDVIAVNRRCYHAELWDSYAWWTDDPCPIGWGNVGSWFAAHHRSPTAWWFKAIAAHPLAYAEHRVRHFAANTRVVGLDRADPVIPPIPDPNPYGFDLPRKGLSRAVNNAAAALAATPFGTPICWMAVATAALAFAPRPRSRLMTLAASSSLLFGMSYLIMSVASDLRYHLWTAVGALTALVAISRERVSTQRVQTGGDGGCRTPKGNISVGRAVPSLVTAMSYDP